MRVGGRGGTHTLLGRCSHCLSLCVSALRVRFAEVANVFVPHIHSLRERLDAQGDLDAQLAAATAVEVRTVAPPLVVAAGWSDGA
jgi:hypothetical protein